MTRTPSAVADALVGGEEAEKTIDTPAPQEWGSVAELEKVDSIASRFPSEVSGIEFLIGASKAVYTLSEKCDKVLPKKTQLGGYGTGQYVPAEAAEGVVFGYPEGDQTLIQFESSLKSDSTSVECMTFYKMVVMLEKAKRLSNFSVSFTDVKRLEQTEAGVDGFELKVKDAKVYKILPSNKQQATCKNVFASYVSMVQASPYLAPIFRWRFEKVGSNFKIQKPYVHSRTTITLAKGKPVKARS